MVGEVFHVCPEATTSRIPERRKRVPQSNEFTIYRKSNLEVLRICVGPITKDDLIKAGKCAKYEKLVAYLYPSGGSVVTASHLPISHNLYIAESHSNTHKTKIFRVCPEVTSTIPRRTAPVIAAPAPTNKDLVNQAIKSFEVGISCLKELSRKL